MFGRADHVGWAKARSAVPTKPFREALMSRHRRWTLFFTLALANRGGNAAELSGRFGE